MNAGIAQEYLRAVACCLSLEEAPWPVPGQTKAASTDPPMLHRETLPCLPPLQQCARI